MNAGIVASVSFFGGDADPRIHLLDRAPPARGDPGWLACRRRGGAPAPWRAGGARRSVRCAATAKAPLTMWAGLVVHPGQLPESRGLLGSENADDLLFGRVERRVNARLHVVPCRLDVLLMSGENLVDGVLLRRTELKLAREPVQQCMRVGRTVFVRVVLLALVHNPSRYAGDEHQHEQKRSSHGRRHRHLLLPRASSNSRLTLGGRSPVAIVRPTGSEGARRRVHCSRTPISPCASPVARKPLERAAITKAIATAAARGPASHCRTETGRFIASAVTRAANASQCCASSRTSPVSNS